VRPPAAQQRVYMTWGMPRVILGFYLALSLPRFDGDPIPPPTRPQG
jgi:hypothetical protein